MDILGIQTDLAKAQASLDEALTRIATLEAQSAKDVGAITDKVIAALLPEVKAARASIDQLTLVASASVTEALALARRIDGAKFSLGPEVPSYSGTGYTSPTTS